ncbi:MAG: c-type cytochrome [Acidobacteriota bacterium]|nr:c-type cytochrome [Acidobacteriota bacterium]
MRSFAIVSVIFVAACAAISQQKAQTPVADNAQFHNLQVLSPNITHDELLSTMRGIARSLGTKCNHCHAANAAGSAEEFDFASDAKPEKKVARTMLRMVRDINANYVSKVNAHGQAVGCFTCHRGHTVPETQAAAAPPEAPTPRQ